MVDLKSLTPGKNAPHEVSVIIEIPKGSRVKYELDPESGILYVDRKLSTSMTYPGNYGFIPQTRAEDGDPIDVLVLYSEPLMPSCAIHVRPVGVLMTEDQDGKDAKIIAVPISDEEYHDVQNITDIARATRKQIEHFFKHHKELEKGKFIKITGWKGKTTATRIIADGIEDYSAEMGATK